MSSSGMLGMVHSIGLLIDSNASSKSWRHGLELLYILPVASDPLIKAHLVFQHLFEKAVEKFPNRYRL